MAKRIEYSPTEGKMLELLREHGLLSTAQLADLHYGTRERPWHAMVIINSAMRSLMAKAARNREPFIIDRFKPVGRNPMMYKIITKTRKREAG